VFPVLGITGREIVHAVLKAQGIRYPNDQITSYVQTSFDKNQNTCFGDAYFCNVGDEHHLHS
jgi:hypothetical protein